MCESSALPEALGSKFTEELNFQPGSVVEVFMHGHSEKFAGCTDLRVAFFSVDASVVSLLTVKTKQCTAVFHDWSGVLVRVQPVGDLQLS